MKKIVLFVLLLKCIDLLSCDCATFTKEKEFNNSEFVAIVQVIDVTENSCTFKVEEIFKGPDTLKIIEIWLDNYCTIVPDSSERWLVYIDTINTEVPIEILNCGWSRCLDRMTIPSNWIMPPPPPPNGVYVYDEESRINRYYSELYNDINSYRLKRIYSELAELESIVEKLSRSLPPTSSSIDGK